MTRLTLLLLLAAVGPVAIAQNAAADNPADDLAGLLAFAESKFVALAEATPDDAWDWRPEDGVRSTSEVLRHVAGANYGMPMMLGIMPPDHTGIGIGPDGPTGFEAFEANTDRDDTAETLAASFDHLREAISSLPDDRMDDEVNVFGQTMTTRAFIFLMATHLHEHLGQLIAYSRTNGITPPWSASADG